MDAICDRFEADLRAGKRPHIESALERVESGREELLENLLRAELEQARAEGTNPRSQAYLARFPSFAPVVVRAFEKTLGECVVVDDLRVKALQCIQQVHLIRRRLTEDPIDEKLESELLLNAFEAFLRSPQLVGAASPPTVSLWTDSFCLVRRSTSGDRDANAGPWRQLLEPLCAAFSPRRAAILRDVLLGHDTLAVSKRLDCSTATVLATCRYALDLLRAKLDRA